MDRRRPNTLTQGNSTNENPTHRQRHSRRSHRARLGGNQASQAATTAYTAEAPVDQASADGYHRASGYEQVKAECELVANGLQPSPGFVIGSREYVAGAAIGSAIGGLIVHAQNYQNCMTLKGYAHN